MSTKRQFKKKGSSACQKLALTLVLLLDESPELIIDQSPFLEKKFNVWIHTYGSEMKKALGKYVEDKTSLYFFFNTIIGLKSHFHHTSVQSDKTERRRIMHKIAWLYSYSNTDLNSDQMLSEFNLNLHGLTSDNSGTA